MLSSGQVLWDILIKYFTLAWVTRRCPGWFKIGIKKSIETQEPSPPLEDHLCAKFRPDPSSRLDFYREHTHTQTLPFMY